MPKPEIDSAWTGDKSLAVAFMSDHLWVLEQIDALCSPDGVIHAERFGVLVARLRNHIQAEEEVLFPVFERLSGLHGEGPTALLRREHELVREHLGRIADALKAPPQPEEARRLLRRMGALLEDHARREETLLYAVCDRMLSPSERDDVVRMLGERFGER